MAKSAIAPATEHLKSCYEDISGRPSELDCKCLKATDVKKCEHETATGFVSKLQGDYFSKARKSHCPFCVPSAPATEDYEG